MKQLFIHIRIVTIVLVTMILSSCHSGTSPDRSGDEAAGEPGSGSSTLVITREQFNAAGMKLGSPDSVRFSQEITGNGYVRASVNGKVAVSTLVPGRIVKITKTIGDRVVAGGALYVLEGNEIVDLQKEFAAESQSLKEFERAYERQRSLAEEQIASEKDLLNAESNYRKLLADVQGMRSKLELIGISPEKVKEGTITSRVAVSAPIDGVITRQRATRGAFVEPGEELAVVVDPDQLVLELHLFQKELQGLEPGFPVQFYAPDTPGKIWNATLTRIGRAIEPESRTAMCLADIDRGDQADLVEGMFTEFRIITCERNTLAIPEYAAVQEHDRYFVYRLEEENDKEFIFKKVPIDAGAVQGGYIEVLEEGLEGILIEGSYLVSGSA
jgi:cobalt-zinc-cadmium efflux system membrane fusion protein